MKNQASAVRAKSAEFFAAVADQFKLTPGEQLVTPLLFQGETQPAIAKQTKLTVNTVKGYVKTIYSKLDVHNRAQFMKAVMSLSAPPPVDVS